MKPNNRVRANNDELFRYNTGLVLKGLDIFHRAQVVDNRPQKIQLLTRLLEVIKVIFVGTRVWWLAIRLDVVVSVTTTAGPGLI